MAMMYVYVYMVCMYVCMYHGCRKYLMYVYVCMCYYYIWYVCITREGMWNMAMMAMATYYLWAAHSDPLSGVELFSQWPDVAVDI